ncbi:MAG TPA: PAS domain-containing protein [Candidatus Saccharimonadales bacterium]|nr:PAS domain-containing protein [Candidatus Saccharimonadales bacterium]
MEKPLDPKMLSLVMQNLPEIVMAVDEQGNILFINHVLPQYTIDQVIGTPMFNYIPPGEHEVMRQSLQKVFQGGEKVEFEIPGSGPDGQTSWYRSEMTPVKDETGKIIGATNVSRDITKEKVAADELSKAQRVVADQEAKIAQLQEKTPGT